MRMALLLLACLWTPCLALAAKTLDVYFIDVEGGQATLVVTPSGQSILTDVGWPGFSGRDANRILAAAKAAKVKAIDYLVITHYHTDHVGGIDQLAGKIPIRNFVDHGGTVETSKTAGELFGAYEKAFATGKRLSVKPGDTLPLKGVEMVVVAANGEKIQQPIAGGGAANPLCAGAEKRNDDPSENARSVGTLLTFGKFRMINLGDLTWNKELELVCPNNSVGTVDVYLTTHHGMNMSGPAAIVHALAPRVAIMNNGARKGGTAEAWQVVKKSPGLEDLWQVHFAIAGGKENNSPEVFIANPEEGAGDLGHYLKLSAMPDGSFTVTNSRNKYAKSYAARPR